MATLTTSNQRLSQPDKRKKRTLWIIGAVIVLCIVAFIVISAFVLIRQGMTQAISILTIISIIIGIIVALVGLFLAYLQVHYQSQPVEPPMTSLVSSRATGILERDVTQPLEAQIENQGKAQENGGALSATGSRHFPINWGEAPRAAKCYGRAQKITQIVDDIVADRRNIVAILGGGGIGKTSLAVNVVEQVKNDFSYVLWYSMRNAPPLSKLLQDSIQMFSEQQRIQLPQGIDEQISILLGYLQEKRCLLILDNVESILLSGSHLSQYQTGYEEYGSLFLRIGETRHQSCLLLTSREPPREIMVRDGDPTTIVRVHFLDGLQFDDGRVLLHNQEVNGTDEAMDHLIQKYAGNPLALIHVSHYINELFAGDIAKFLTEDTAVTSDIGNLLNQQFNRLSPLEQDIMYWLAIEREPISLSQLQENFFSASWQQDKRNHFHDALRSLRRRSLVEMNNNLFTLQNVIMEYTNNHFLDRIFEEIVQEAH